MANDTYIGSHKLDLYNSNTANYRHATFFLIRLCNSAKENYKRNPHPHFPTGNGTFQNHPEVSGVFGTVRNT